MPTLSSWDHPMVMLQWGAALGTSLTAAIWDVASGRIPNYLTAPAWLLGMAVALYARGGSGLLDAFEGTLLLAAPFIVLFLIASNDGGAGDAKLMGALGAWLGFHNSVVALVTVTACGAIIGIGYAMIKGRLGSVLANLKTICWGHMLKAGGNGQVPAELLSPPKDKMLQAPYGVSIFAGMCCAAGGIWLWH